MMAYHTSLLSRGVLVQWNLNNEVLGTMKITLLYQVSHYIRVKNKEIQRAGTNKLPCNERVMLYLTSLSQGSTVLVFGNPCDSMHCEQ